MSTEALLALGGVLVLIALSALFSASETALTAVSRARMHALEEEGNARARRVNRLLMAPERMIGTILLANTLVDVAAASLATLIGLAEFGPPGAAYATALLTIVLVVLGAALPKTYALANADRVALAVAPVMSVVIAVLQPASAAIQALVRGLLKLLGVIKEAAPSASEAHEELRGTIGLQSKEGTVAKLEADMLGGVLDLKELSVADIMVHRTKMHSLAADTPPEALIGALVASQYTRVPIWRDTPENIIGVLNTKDLLAALARVGFDVKRLDMAELVKPPWFVPDTTSLKAQLETFLKRKAQLALVVDEYGEVEGLITLEDILEEIVGQIGDEHDVGEPTLRRAADGSVIVDGATPIRDLNRDMNLDLPDDEATTVAGLVIHEAQAIPEPGQTFTFYGYRFEILRKTRNRITTVRIRPETAPAGAAKPGDKPGSVSGAA